MNLPYLEGISLGFALGIIVMSYIATFIKRRFECPKCQYKIQVENKFKYELVTHADKTSTWELKEIKK